MERSCNRTARFFGYGLIACSSFILGPVLGKGIVDYREHRELAATATELDKPELSEYFKDSSDKSLTDAVLAGIALTALNSVGITLIGKNRNDRYDPAVQNALDIAWTIDAVIGAALDKQGYAPEGSKELHHSQPSTIIPVTELA